MSTMDFGWELHDRGVITGFQINDREKDPTEGGRVAAENESAGINSSN